MQWHVHSFIKPRSALDLLLSVVECHESDVYQALLKYPFDGGTSLEATSSASFQITAVQIASQHKHLPLYLCKYVIDRREKVRSINY